MDGSTFLHPELLLRILKFVLSVTSNGLNQYLLETSNSKIMRAVAALALLTLMQVIIMVPLNSLVLKTHPELRTFVWNFDLIGVVVLTFTAVLATKEISRVNSLASACLVPQSKAIAIKATAGIAWACVFFDVVLLTYALHEIGRLGSNGKNTASDCESQSAAKADLDLEKEVKC